MDISILLALDSGAFQRGLAAASSALEALKSGADACFDALGQAEAQMDAAAEAAAQQAASAQQAAAATTDAAGATEALAEAQRSQGAAAIDAGKALQGASAAASVMPGPLGEIARGALSAAGAAQKAGEAARQFGVSMEAATRTVLVLALVAAVAKLVQTIRETRRAADEMRESIKSGNLAAAADDAAAAYGRLIEKIDAAAARERARVDAAAPAREAERAAELEEVEAERQRRILAGGDETAANDWAARERARISASHEREDLRGESRAARLELMDNMRRAEIMREEEERLRRIALEQTGDDKTRTMERANAVARDRQGVLDANAALQLRIDGEGARARLIDLRERNAAGALDVEAQRRADAEAEAAAAAEEAASSAAARKAERAARAAPAWEAVGGAGSEAAIQTDRLARIGGFVGGGAAAASDAARETLETAREQKRLLEKIARNTENNSRPGGDGAQGLA